MKPVPIKNTGDQYSAEEFNELPRTELTNMVESAGISLSEADQFQLAKAIANYVAYSDFYVDSGSANAYVLTPFSPTKGITQYKDGARVRFMANASNTGASTANVNGEGVENIKDADGNNLHEGAILISKYYELFYDGTNLVLSNSSRASSDFSTGDAKFTIKNTSDPGWVLMNDGTIGSAGSGATTRANADCEFLYKLMWDNIIDLYAPVTGGRGVSAAADWTANKPIGLTKQLGRSIAVSGAGAGLTVRALGEDFGEENHQLTIAELAAHVHPPDPSVGNFVGGGAGGRAAGGDQLLNFTNTGSAGGDTAHNTMQPTAFWNVMIKL